MSADTYHYLSVFREHTKQQLQPRVSVTTTLDPPLPQQTIAPSSALPTSIHQHSLVSLPFSSWLLHVFCFHRRKEKHSLERRKAWLQRVQVRQSPTTFCGFKHCNAVKHLDFILIVCSLSLYLVGLVGELLSSTSTRYAKFTAAPSPHPSPPHSTQWINYYFTPCICTFYRACIKLYNYVSWCISLSFCFQGAYYAAATVLYNSGSTSTSANHHDIGPFQRSLLGELACLFPVGYYACFLVTGGKSLTREGKHGFREFK